MAASMIFSFDESIAVFSIYLPVGKLCHFSFSLSRKRWCKKLTKKGFTQSHGLIPAKFSMRMA
jgi:hypothetical protein